MFARIVNNTVFETLDVPSIDGLFHPSLVWMACPPETQQGWIVLDGQIVDPFGIAACHAKIDVAAGAARARYITVAPGQEGTYLEKRRQADEFASYGFVGAAPSYVAAEATATGLTTQQAAELILAQAAAWDVKGAQIEQARRGWKLAIAGSTNREADLRDALSEIAAL